MATTLVLFSGCDEGNPIVSEEQRLPLERFLVDSIAVTPNPNQIAPLTAKTTFQTKDPTQITIKVLGNRPLTHRYEEKATEHELPILGLYPDTENRVQIRVTDAAGNYAVDTLHITTDPLPAYFPEVNVTTAQTEQMEPGWTLSSLSLGDGGTFRTEPIMYDANGDIRWYVDLSFLHKLAYGVNRFENGHLHFTSGHAVYEYNMLGKEINEWEFSGYTATHDVIEKPDGNLLVAANKGGLSTVGDHVIEIDRTSGNIVNTWDVRKVLDVERDPYLGNDTDWFHINAIWYDASDEALIISGRNQGVVKVSRDNELIWILTPHKGWENINAHGDTLSNFLLTAVDEEGIPYSDAVQQGSQRMPGFDWPWGEHAPMILPNGNIFLFDNGPARHFSNSEPTYSRGAEYAIDESARTVHQIWQYGRRRGSQFYSPAISDVDYLPQTKNRLIMPGLIKPHPRSIVTEVEYNSLEVVFEAHILFQDILSSGSGWGRDDIVYRSERMSLYPPQ